MTTAFGPCPCPSEMTPMVEASNVAKSVKVRQYQHHVLTREKHEALRISRHKTVPQLWKVFNLQKLN